jgi:ABC-2 type transport system permease protein
MLSSLATKSLRDVALWTGAAIGLVLVLVAIVMPVYDVLGEQYMSLLESMPAWIAVVYGEAAGDTAGLVGIALFTLMGPLIVLVYAIGLGTGAAVGEEEAGTLPLLLANPLSRTRVLATKAAVTALGIILITMALWLTIAVAAPLVGVDLSSQDFPAASLHLVAFALLGGALALAVAAWTGSSMRGIAAAALVMVVSYVWATWMPLAQDLADLAEWSPWQLYGGSDALRQGLDPLRLAVTLLLAAAFFGIGVAGLRRRDLRS